MRVGSSVAWLVAGVIAAAMGLGLISDEPGATAARWYLVFAVAAIALGLAARRGKVPDRLLVVASLVVTAVIALHAFAIVAFAYQGLTLLILPPALLATLLAAGAWARASRASAQGQA